jgi:uncharacterized protein YeeX (DUF496 family)
VYLYVSIVPRIITIVPVTTSPAKRSFLMLKLMKTYLKITMRQEQLMGFVIFSTENDVTSALDYSEILDSFSSRKRREIYSMN